MFLSKEEVNGLFCERENAGQRDSAALPRAPLHHGRREVAKAERKGSRRCDPPPYQQTLQRENEVINSIDTR